MKTKVLVAMCLAVLGEAFVAGQAAAPQRSASGTPAPASSVATRALLDQYCVVCHNEKLKTANLLLDNVDLTRLADHRQIAEKVVRKMRAGMMPPSGMPRPDAATREQLISWLEQELDARATPHLPAPGIHRLNRTEYTNVIRDLLGLEVDATKFLPSDDSTSGFDNIAGALRMSPALLEAYVSAAGSSARCAGSWPIPNSSTGARPSPQTWLRERRIESVIWRWRPGFPSSCGAASPTTSS